MGLVARGKEVFDEQPFDRAIERAASNLIERSAARFRGLLDEVFGPDEKAEKTIEGEASGRKLPSR